jgi:hypothetical protein
MKCISLKYEVELANSKVVTHLSELFVMLLKGQKWTTHNISNTCIITFAYGLHKYHRLPCLLMIFTLLQSVCHTLSTNHLWSHFSIAKEPHTNYQMNENAKFHYRREDYHIHPPWVFLKRNHKQKHVTKL